MRNTVRDLLGLIGGILLSQIIWFGSYSPIDYIEVYASSWPTIRDSVYISTTALIYITSLSGIVIILGAIFNERNRAILRVGSATGLLGLSLTIDFIWDVIGIVLQEDLIVIAIAWIGLIMSIGVTAMTRGEQTNQDEEMQPEVL